MSVDTKQIKPSEFYMKYWLVELPDGTKVHPQPLSEKERDFMDEMFNHPNNMKFLYYGRGRRRNVQVDIQKMKSDMEKLPTFLKQ